MYPTQNPLFVPGWQHSAKHKMTSNQIFYTLNKSTKAFLNHQSKTWTKAQKTKTKKQECIHKSCGQPPNLISIPQVPVLNNSNISYKQYTSSLRALFPIIIFPMLQSAMLSLKVVEFLCKFFFICEFNRMILPESQSRGISGRLLDGKYYFWKLNFFKEMFCFFFN